MTGYPTREVVRLAIVIYANILLWTIILTGVNFL